MDLVIVGKKLFDVDEIDDRDPRTKDWITMKTPYPVLLMVFSYLFFVLKLGPRLMLNRKPYNLKIFIKFYNMFQIIANAAIVYCTINFGLFTDIPLTCVPMDYSMVGNPMKMAVLFWFVWLLKATDLVETLIFVLRKKTKQVTYLHLYHHASTMLFSWLVVKIFPGGVMSVHAAINSSTHVIMYSYYFASSLGCSTQRLVKPYKKYVTIIQMVQFVVLFLYSLQGYGSACILPRWGTNMVIANLILNFALFFNFYRNTYLTPKSKST